MLVVSRKVEESIIIESENGGTPIEVKIISIDNQVKVGIDAPKGCKIWRKELYKTVEANRSAAAAAAGANLKALISRLEPAAAGEEAEGK